MRGPSRAIGEFDSKNRSAPQRPAHYSGRDPFETGTMRTYRFQGIPDSIATAARESMKSPQYGHPAHAELATGYGPCRLCLQTFRVGTDERLLFTYQPFTDPSALPAPGPVFIHREGCERYDGRSYQRRSARFPWSWRLWHRRSAHRPAAGGHVVIAPFLVSSRLGSRSCSPRPNWECTFS